jgi:hypothetical protein
MSEWIKWRGGECPVEKGVLVDVRYRDEVEKFSIPALELDRGRDATKYFWINDRANNDIIAYRLSETRQQPMMKAESFLNQAAKHMDDRASTYDKPEGERSISQVVAIFNLYHGTNLTEAQGWHFMEIVKNVRFFTASGFHRDSGEDAIAYAALKAEAKQREG